MDGYFIDYTHAIRIERVVDVNDIQARDVDIREERLRNATENISIYHRYIETEIDVEYQTIKDAIQNNKYRDNECWINALVETYEGTELMREKRSNKTAKTLSRNKVLELLNLNEDEFIEKGASINQMDVVFKHFNIPAKLYSFTNQIIYKNEPTTRAHTRIRTFLGLVKNNHVYTINYNIESLRQKAQVENCKITAPNTYYLNSKDEPVKYKAIDNVDEILGLTEDDEYYLIQKENDMAKVVHQLKSAGYEPDITYQVGMISQVRARFRFKKLKKTIHYTFTAQNLSKSGAHCQIVLQSEEKFNRLTEAMFKFNKNIFQEKHKSRYNEDILRMLDETKTRVPMGYFNKDVLMKHLAEIDENKAFTRAFELIKFIPVITEFDILTPYEGQDIYAMDGLTMYYVEAFKGDIFLNANFNLVFGYNLKKYMKYNTNYKIHSFVQPSNKFKVAYAKYVKELYDTYISDDPVEDKQCKKTVANVNFGLLEKSHRTKQISKIFNSLRECCYNQHIYGGKVYTISEQEEIMKDVDDEIFFERKDTGKSYYILNVSDKQKLIDGFRLIKEMILQNHNFIMFEAYQKMKAEGVRVYSVKSDAFTIHKDDIDKVAGYKFGKRTVEGRRREAYMHINFPTDEYKYRYNEYIKVNKMKNETVRFEDEWDRENICKYIQDRDEPVIILGKFPGTGKSAIGEYFAGLDKNVLFVMPNNRQRQEKLCGGLEAITYNTFFSVAVDVDDAEGGKLPKYDYSPYDVIVFDEVFMLGTFWKNKIRMFNKDNPDKIRILTGDTKQLPSLEESTNCQDVEVYAHHCVDVICPYRIFLSVCKRVGPKDSEEGELNRKMLNDIYDEWWEKKLPLKEIIPRHFETTDDIMASEFNIAYTNERCRNVGNEVRQRLGKKGKYEVGEVLIARTWVKKPRINVNIRYCITNIEGRKLTLQNIANEKDKFDMYEEHVDNIFIYSHCATCHSCQGASVKESITIHEWDTFGASREWVWTALTRCVDFRKVKFCLNKDFDKEMEVNMYKRYFQNKIDGYKIQDKKAGREIDEDEYVDVEWCMDRMKGTCQKCNIWFDFKRHHGRINSDFTAQRLDNQYAHYKSNCVAYCKDCNCSSR
eukprot:Skav205305  [mRNA]  locus=scaffold3444:24630:27985:- [translate_table: standard]